MFHFRFNFLAFPFASSVIVLERYRATKLAAASSKYPMSLVSSDSISALAVFLFPVSYGLGLYVSSWDEVLFLHIVFIMLNVVVITVDHSMSIDISIYCML
jgi:hypothetical protein